MPSLVYLIVRKQDNVNYYAAKGKVEADPAKVCIVNVSSIK